MFTQTISGRLKEGGCNQDDWEIQSRVHFAPSVWSI